MSLDAVRAYHEASKLSRLDDAPRRVDAALVPRPYKRYIGVSRIALPRPATTEKSFFEAPAAEHGPGKRLSLPDLAGLLRYSGGIVRRGDAGGRQHEFRAASCTGAAYHVELYVVCGGMEGLEAGLYHYDVADDDLALLASGDHRDALAAACAEAGLAGAEASIVLTSTFWRNAWRYQERAYRHVFWDSGTILANLLALAAAHEVQTRLYTGFVDDRLNALLDLDAMREAVVAAVALGPWDVPPGRQGTPPSGLETLPLSRIEIEYPAIWQTHEATGLANAAAVHAWRRDGSSARHEPRSPSEATAQVPDLHSAIERRGSARRFAQRPMSRAELDAVLWSLEALVPADAAVPDGIWRALLIAHAVEGVEPGTYATSPGGALSLLRRGNFRSEATRLALDQDAAGRAAANIYFVVDLEALLRELGPRGYRLAQLAAGVLTGRVYLACASMGLRTTGLTFYDDEVASFFGLPPDRTAVLMLAAFGP